MNPDFPELITFVLITTFTPGPNNISSASMGILFGYRKTINYLLGIASGFFLIMFGSSLVSSSLFILFPNLEKIIRYLGAIYILWLAYRIARSSYNFNESEQKAMNFMNGILLQLLNPKAMVFGLTVFSLFLTPIDTSFQFNLSSAIVLTIVNFSATSSWTLFGTAIRKYLKNQRIKVIINFILSVLLIVTAFQIAFV